MGEALSNNLAAVGIRTRVRSMERATYMEAWRTKKLQGLILTVTAAQGNAASRIEAFVISSSTYAYGGYPGNAGPFLPDGPGRDPNEPAAPAPPTHPGTAAHGLAAPVI